MPSPWLAVGAATDLRAHARELQRSWERLLGEGALGAEPPPEATAGLRPTILESWQRSLDTGLDPTGFFAPIEVEPAEVQDRWLEHPLGSVGHVLAAQFGALAEETHSLVVVTDASGLLLHTEGPEWLKDAAREMNFCEGALFSDMAAGTNGVGTALVEDHALQVFAFEHFNQIHNQWTCSGSPVHDPVSGRMVGVLDLTSPWKIAHPRSLELVITAARTMERCLLDIRHDQDARLRRRYGDLMTRSADLLVDRDGYVLDGDEPKRPTPLEIPEGGGEIVLGDGLVAVAEPLGYGEAYLVRRAGSRGAKSTPIKALGRAEKRARELATEQAALRQVATLVARESSPDQLIAVIAKQAARMFDAPLVMLVRYEHDDWVVVGGFGECRDGPFSIGSRWPLDSPGVIASVRQSGRPARVQDYAGVPGRVAAVVRRLGMRSAVASPIVVQGRLWGAMVIASPRSEPLPDDTEPRLTDFTELVAMAIADAESRAALHRLADEQSALQRVATLVAQGVSPDEIFSAVANEITRLFGAEAATTRFEPDGSAMVFLAVTEGIPVVSVGTRWPLEDFLASTAVYRSGRPARSDHTGDGRTSGMVADSLRQMNFVSTVAAPIVVENRLWGTIMVSDQREPLPPDTEERVAKFTELVGTAVANAESRAQLAASRARVIAAGDDARRRIERDLHDGAQQRLVTLAIALRRAEAKVPASLDELRADVTRVAEGLTTALDELRETSRGIHPAVLTEGGLSPALKALGRRSAVRVKLDVPFEHRLPDQVEVAAYYTVSEALTNASKHANATCVWVSLRMDDDVLHLAIRDDGVGGADPSLGSGLTGLRDRIETLGGRLQIESPLRSGTRIEVEIPIG